ncbi:hypothetical protein [Niastella yeongjuensis]|nr:hypothetical protein [Niastella yeongjuensis]SEP45862.1 hypothetical protein SAMN05660816_06370 [Niastella yeongjuensis]
MEQIEVLANKEKNIEPAYKVTKKKKTTKEEYYRMFLNSKGK